MNKHEWIKNKLINALDSYDDGTLKLQVIEYINEAEATENKLHQVEIENITLKLYREKYIELQRDVDRYFELKGIILTFEEEIEFNNLLNKFHERETLNHKLSKVGVEEK